MVDLAPMSADAAERFLSEVAWADRFPATINSKRGFSKIVVFSVDELLRVAEGGATIISGPAFAIWAESVLGDPVLAAALVDSCDGTPLFKQTPIVLELVTARRTQALDALRPGVAIE